MADYYKILEITPTATCEDIKKSYRRLALKYHPDKNSGTVESHELFTKISQAYKTLSNEESRKRYDVTYKIKLAHQLQPLTPQLFLDKFKNIREFIFNKGKNKISQSALYKALNNLLSDNNIKYLSLKNNVIVNEQIIKEVLRCCDFLSSHDVERIANRLILLANSDDKIIHNIHTYVESHKDVKESIIIKALTVITHKVATFFD